MFKKRGIIIYSGLNLIYKPKFTYMYTHTKITEHFKKENKILIISMSNTIFQNFVLMLR